MKLQKTGLRQNWVQPRFYNLWPCLIRFQSFVVLRRKYNKPTSGQESVNLLKRD